MEFRIGVNLGEVIEEGDRIYGDGVNIAARLESLAKPGGICISGFVYHQVKNRLKLEYEYLGEQSVKNIKEPVPVYRVLSFPGAAAHRVIEAKKAVEKERTTYPLADKPSIAVLAFWNMSGDPTQEYIGDGISENIIATLSKIGGMFVIASNSTFTYKGKPIKVQQVAEELGVQYVLEGSVQKSGDRLRVTAQLIDALTGHHLWSEKYDRKMEDLFDLQDEITKKIVVSLQVELTRGEEALVDAKDTDNLEAWGKVTKGYNYFIKATKEDNERARQLFEEAVKLDPKYATAWAMMGWSYGLDLWLGWSESPPDSLKLAREAGQKALAIDDQHPYVFAMQGIIHLVQRQYDQAIDKLRKSVSIDPNYFGGHLNLAITTFYVGRFEEALELIKKAMRLSPCYGAVVLRLLGHIYFFLDRYEEAITTFTQLDERARKGEYQTYFAPLYLALVYEELGREEEARAYITEALKCNRNLSLELIVQMNPFKNPAHLQRELDNLRKAGLPEKPPKAVR
jgi:adenylate cyclase